MMTPQAIHECRRKVQYHVSGLKHTGHRVDPLIRDCLPAALDEVERLRQGLIDVIRILDDKVQLTDQATFSADVLAAASSAARQVRAERAARTLSDSRRGW